MKVTVSNGGRIVFSQNCPLINGDPNEAIGPAAEDRYGVLEALREAHESLILAGGPRPNPAYAASQRPVRSLPGEPARPAPKPGIQAPTPAPRPPMPPRPSPAPTPTPVPQPMPSPDPNPNATPVPKPGPRR